MNYKHAYHAGNFADVVKHLAFLYVLQHLRKKPKGFAVIDTHGGAGRYNLAGDKASRTGEAARGVLQLKGLGGPLLTPYLAGIEGTRYPGSPLMAARMLRDNDRLVAVEKNPEEAETLRRNLRNYPKAMVEEADGYRRLRALTPPPERRAAILIDPPFEETNEFVACADAVVTAYRRFPTGNYIIWFPVKSRPEVDKFIGEILASGVGKAMRVDMKVSGLEEGKLSETGLLMINPPYGFEAAMREALEPVLPRLEAEVRFTWLAGSE